MGRHSTFPATYDSALTLRLSTLVKPGYLNYSSYTGSVYWTNAHGNRIASIGFTLHRPDMGRLAELQLEYRASGQERKYTIQLQAQPSNLGQGLVWYFVCPATGKRCRKLYNIGPDSYFLHRTAYSGVFYDSQICSKYYRSLDSTLGAYFKVDKAYMELYSKGFTKYYAGKPTKRYRRIKKLLDQAEQINPIPVEEILYPGKKRI